MRTRLAGVVLLVLAVAGVGLFASCSPSDPAATRRSGSSSRCRIRCARPSWCESAVTERPDPSPLRRKRPESYGG